jgi:hypothetical protein
MFSEWLLRAKFFVGLSEMLVVLFSENLRVSGFKLPVKL